jgi:transposase InsO family protein
VLEVSESGYYASRSRAPYARSLRHAWLICFDNAVMESFWSRIQVELLDRKRWITRLELANAIFEYLEICHNRRRRHSSLSMLTPVEFEARHQPTTAA